MITLDTNIQERNLSVPFMVNVMLGCLLLRKSNNLESVSLLSNKDSVIHVSKPNGWSELIIS